MFNLFYAASGDEDNWLVRLWGADYFRFRNMTLYCQQQSQPGPRADHRAVRRVENLTVEGNTLNGSPINSVNANFDIIYGLTLVSSNNTTTLTPQDLPEQHLQQRQHRNSYRWLSIPPF